MSLTSNKASASNDGFSTLTRCYLGLGSNLSNEIGTPSQHIEQAIDRLAAHADIRHVRASSLYASQPMGPQDQPDFVNAVVELDTVLTPDALLDLCQCLEQQAMRVRLRHWGERSLDVDVLLYGATLIDTPRLTVPHAGILERNFVLIPLAELNPELCLFEQRIIDIPMSHDWTGLVRLS